MSLVFHVHLLRGDVVCLGPHVYLLVLVDTRNHEEDPGTSGSSREEQAQSEYDSSLVLLDHLDHQAEGEGEGGDDEEEGAEDEEVGTETLSLLTS